MNLIFYLNLLLIVFVVDLNEELLMKMIKEQELDYNQQEVKETKQQKTKTKHKQTTTPKKCHNRVERMICL